MNNTHTIESAGREPHTPVVWFTGTLEECNQALPLLRHQFRGVTPSPLYIVTH